MKKRRGLINKLELKNVDDLQKRNLLFDLQNVLKERLEKLFSQEKRKLYLKFSDLWVKKFDSRKA